MTDSNGRTTTSPPPANQYVAYSRPPIPGSQPPPGPAENHHPPRPQSTFDAYRPPSSQQPQFQQQQQHQPSYDAHTNPRPLSYAPGMNPINTNHPAANPQELATSVYDSPIATTHQPPQSAATYTSSAYSPEDEPSVPGSMMPGGNNGAPPPLQPSGPAYDARQGLPSQGNAGGATGNGGAYKAYVPPSSAY